MVKPKAAGKRPGPVKPAKAKPGRSAGASRFTAKRPSSPPKARTGRPPFKKAGTSQFVVPAILPDQEERLQKIIAEAGLASRRGAEKMIEDGRVRVNGKIVVQQGLKVNLRHDQVLVDGYPLGPPQRLHYYMFNKPAGYLTTLSDPKDRLTIKSYLDKLPVRVFPVGRLDMDVEGLLILTNDGELAKRLMHPSFHVPKTYRVKVAGRPGEKDLERLRDGSLMLGAHPAAPAEATLIKTAEDRAWIFLTLTEGRHHQVKRMCSAIGHPVLKLKRVSYGGITLGPLKREEIRALTPEEIMHLKAAVNLSEGTEKKHRK